MAKRSLANTEAFEKLIYTSKELSMFLT